MFKKNVWMNTILAIVLTCMGCTAPTPSPTPDPVHPDPVVAKLLLEHLEVRPIIVVVDRETVGDDMWKRVKSLNAFRVHSHVNGRVVTNAPIYLVKSTLYREAAQSRDAKSDAWCKLAAVIMHELAHTEPLTEKAALAAEIKQVEKCLQEGHFHTHGRAYLMELARKHRNINEHAAHSR